MGTFSRLFGKGVSKAGSSSAIARPISAPIMPRPAGPTLVPRAGPTLVPERAAGPTLVPHPSDMPFNASGLSAPGQSQVKGVAAVSPGHSRLTTNKAGQVTSEQTLRTQQSVMSAPEIYGPAQRPVNKGSMWDAVRNLKGGRLDRAAGMAASVGTSKLVLGGLAAGGIAGITGYAGAAAISNQVSMHGQVAKSMNGMRNSLAYGGSNRRQDFEHNPMMTFSRPRVRGGHLGASGGLTLAMSNNRTRQ